MGNTKISVTEADIDDELMQQHAGITSNSGVFKRSGSSKGRFKKPAFRLGSPLVVIFILVVVVLIGGGLGYKKYASLRDENARLSNPQVAAQDESIRLKDEVAQLIELPNETPTIATVVDVEKLKSQAFFANAHNGDRVLFFAQAKKAILYRPGTKKIVEVAPINLGDSGVAGASTTNTTTPTTTPTTKKP